MQTARQKRAGASGQSEAASAAPVGAADTATLKREAERLRNELANERERVKTLQDTNNRVAERLDTAIKSVKAILARQG